MLGGTYLDQSHAFRFIREKRLLLDLWSSIISP